MFQRTSYCVAPEHWQALGRDQIDARVHTLLAASYAKRNYITAKSGDLAEMWLVAFDHEWVAPRTMEPVATHEVEAMVVQNDGVHELLKESACHEWLAEVRRVPRAGVEERPWQFGFSAFRIEENGETWHLVNRAESDAIFDQLLLDPRDESSSSAGGIGPM